MKKKRFNHSSEKKAYRIKRISAPQRRETENRKEVLWLWGLWGSHFAA